MDLIVEHLWKSAILISLFYSFFKVSIRRDTYFQSIRFFLLFGVIASLTIPLIVIPIFVEAQPTNTLLAFTTESSNNINSMASNVAFNWKSILLISYFITSMILTFRFLLQLISLRLLIVTKNSFRSGKFIIIETSEDISPFSFFNYIIYNPSHFSNEELKQILAHEKVHALQKHSIDTIVSNILIIFLWFNPLAWLYKKEIEQNLEYIADKYAQKYSRSEKSYQQLLLKISIPNYQMALANNFYNSLIKKRIIMLHKNRSHSRAKWKLALIAPFLIAFIATFNTEVVAQKKEKKVKVEKIEVEIFAQVISKDTDKKTLDNMVKSFDEKGLTVKLKDVKRNSDNEIISIKIDAKTKNGKAAASYASQEENGIKPIKITFDEKNNSISIGSSHEMKHDYHFLSDSDHKKVIKKRIKSDSNNFIFINGDDDEETINVWVDKNGDTTKIKTKKIVVKVEGDGDHKHEDIREIIIDSDDNNEDTEKEVIIIKKKKEGKNFVFISNDDDDKGASLYIIDGKKVNKEDFKKISADNIEKVEVLKGDKATEKYGKEAKNGVILITTKKK